MITPNRPKQNKFLLEVVTNHFALCGAVPHCSATDWLQESLFASPISEITGVPTASAKSKVGLTLIL